MNPKFRIFGFFFQICNVAQSYDQPIRRFKAIWLQTKYMNVEKFMEGSWLPIET